MSNYEAPSNEQIEARIKADDEAIAAIVANGGGWYEDIYYRGAADATLDELLDAYDAQLIARHHERVNEEELNERWLHAIAIEIRRSLGR